MDDMEFGTIPPGEALPAVGWLAIDEKCRFKRRDGDRAYLYLTNGVVIAFRIKETEGKEEWYIVGGINLRNAEEVKMEAASGG